MPRKSALVTHALFPVCELGRRACRCAIPRLAVLHPASCTMEGASRRATLRVHIQPHTLCLLRGCVTLEYGLVSLSLHCFLRLAPALYCRSRRCLASVALSV